MWLRALLLLAVPAALATLNSNSLRDDGYEGPVWGWQCLAGRCERVQVHDEEGHPRDVHALAVCKLLCGSYANLWPKPQDIHVDNEHTIAINFNSINVELHGRDGEEEEKRSGTKSESADLLQRAVDRFMEKQTAKSTDADGTSLFMKVGYSLEVVVELVNATLSQLTLETDEGYELTAAVAKDDRMGVSIRADNFFGARHALETLDQLLVVDDLHGQLAMPRGVRVRDRPAFAYRGVLLDTSRNFVSVDAIRRTIRAMAASKLNTFHWHITDSHSFPFVSETFPRFHKYGAYAPDKAEDMDTSSLDAQKPNDNVEFHEEVSKEYLVELSVVENQNSPLTDVNICSDSVELAKCEMSPDNNSFSGWHHSSKPVSEDDQADTDQESQQVYSPTAIRDLLEFAREHGVRLLPELDAPAHVGEGWQWVGDNTTICVKAEPWQKYCVEPPCGQLNPTVDKVYDILGGLYKDMLSVFKPDMFHMGGDEVNFHCWNDTESILHWMKQRNLSGRQDDDFRMVWDHFQRKAYQKLVDANGGSELPVVIWTSGLTAPGKVDKYLDPQKYIIQIWTRGNDTLIRELALKKYRLIFSNYDALYFDCGFGAWVGEGNNWCSPYIGWQKVYDNDLNALLLALDVEPTSAHVLGAEATLWTEQADSQSVDGRLWPRAAAMAERLWSNPTSNWEAAEYRMLSHRERLVKLGVQADSLQPEWCLQNEAYCYLNKSFTGEA